MKQRVAMAGLAVAAVGGAFAVGHQTASTSTKAAQGRTAPQITTSGEWNRYPNVGGSEPGPCGGSIPLSRIVDPCLKVRGALGSGGMLQNLVRTPYFQTWARDNPGELAKIRWYFAHPDRADGAQKPGGGMSTKFGGTLLDVVSAYGSAGGVPTVLPAP